MKESIICLLLLAASPDTFGQKTWTENPHHTVTYNPGRECLPYDGSVVPNCWDYIDPVTQEPAFHVHSANCSRFWECGPAGETCLFECAHCGGPSNAQCQDQWALTFDPSYVYPYGPVCDWPGNVDCNVGCPLGSECCENTGCNKCSGGYCNLDWTCTYPEDCCTSDSECDNYDGECSVPGPHSPDSCAYCDHGQCVGGCADLGPDSDNCPTTHPTCSSGHQCGCSGSEECDKYDGECDMADSSDPYTGHCYYCDAGNAQCVPGCGGLENNNYNCPTNYECNLSTHQCELSVCDDNTFCDGFDQICNSAYDNCFFCGGNCGASDGCCEGCHDDDLNCAYPQPICNQDTNTCGCQDDDDCAVTDFCNPETDSCEVVPDECETDEDCNDGITGICETGVAEQTQCKYCTPEGHRNVCKPGCLYDSSSNDIPRCSPEAPVCNTETNICQANSGSVLLTKMVFTSRSCEGCDTEGVNMTLTGTFLQNPSPQCKTVDLDHPNQPDFKDTSTFLSIPSEQDNGWNNCWNGPLDGLVTAAVVTWTGSGQWSPDTICYDWDKHSMVVSLCTFPEGTTLAYGEQAAGLCSFSGDTSCP